MPNLPRTSEPETASSSERTGKRDLDLDRRCDWQHHLGFDEDTISAQVPGNSPPIEVLAICGFALKAGFAP